MTSGFVESIDTYPCDVAEGVIGSVGCGLPTTVVPDTYPTSEYTDGSDSVTVALNVEETIEYVQGNSDGYTLDVAISSKLGYVVDGEMYSLVSKYENSSAVGSSENDVISIPENDLCVGCTVLNIEGSICVGMSSDGTNDRSSEWVKPIGMPVNPSAVTILVGGTATETSPNTKADGVLNVYAVLVSSTDAFSCVVSPKS